MSTSWACHRCHRNLHQNFIEQLLLAERAQAAAAAIWKHQAPSSPDHDNDHNRSYVGFPDCSPEHGSGRTPPLLVSPTTRCLQGSSSHANPTRADNCSLDALHTHPFYIGLSSFI